MAITQWILGDPPDVAGLQIAPVIPASGRVSRRAAATGVWFITSRVERRGPGNAVRLVVDGQRFREMSSRCRRPA